MSAYNGPRRRLSRWLLRNEVPRRINAVHVRDAIYNELAGTDDPAVEKALHALLEQVGSMEWTP